LRRIAQERTARDARLNEAIVLGHEAPDQVGGGQHVVHELDRLPGERQQVVATAAPDGLHEGRAHLGGVDGGWDRSSDWSTSGVRSARGAKGSPNCDRVKGGMTRSRAAP
jgi:hypothetical protein